MKELAKEAQEIEPERDNCKEALKLFESLNESYKIEIIKQINPKDQISTYKQTDFYRPM